MQAVYTLTKHCVNSFDIYFFSLRNFNAEHSDWTDLKVPQIRFDSSAVCFVIASSIKSTVPHCKLQMTMASLSGERVKRRSEGLFDVNIFINHVHVRACSHWMNEVLLHFISGCVTCNIHYSY